MDLNKLEAYAKHGDMGPYSAQFVELIALIRKQEAALNSDDWKIADPAGVVARLRNAAQRLLNEASKNIGINDTDEMALATAEVDDALAACVGWPAMPSVATVDTSEFYGRITCCILAPNAEKDEEIAGLIAHIDAHVAAQVAAERLRADNADGMAECMRMFRDDMISAGIIDAGVAPMFMSEAIMRVVAAKDAEIKTLKAALDAQGELTDRYQEIALSAQAAAPMAYLRFRAARQWSGVGGSDIEYAEWYETCQAHEIGDDKKPAFPVYAVPQPSPAPVAMTDEKERELFEQSERESELSMDSDGDYANPCVQSAWEGWKARAILAAQQEAV